MLQSVGETDRKERGRMHGWGTRMLLKECLAQGVSKTELSRRFGVSRRTIYEWIETGQLDRDLSAGATRYSRRAPVTHKLDPYKGIIRERLEEFPRLSAQRLFEEVQASGYGGSYGRVRDYVRTVRVREPVETVVRFETPAGRQGQVDFGTFRLPWGRRYALLVVLSYSRLLWLRFFPRQTMAVLLEGLESAFQRFGGVPEELLFDQMRAVVVSDGRAGGGELVVNAEFLRFAAHWGFRAGADQGEGGAADPLRSGQFLLRPGLRQRRGPECAGDALVGGPGEPATPRYDRGASRRPLPAGRTAGVGSVGERVRSKYSCGFPMVET